MPSEPEIVEIIDAENYSNPQGLPTIRVGHRITLSKEAKEMWGFEEGHPISFIQIKGEPALYVASQDGGFPLKAYDKRRKDSLGISNIRVVKRILKTYGLTDKGGGVFLLTDELEIQGVQCFKMELIKQ